jgi:chorismatase
MWNFIEGINANNDDGLELYRDFCLGRAEAFERFPADIEMPAATGIGSLGGGIGFYFLAAHAAERVNVENPRQQPAYHYPRQYGPKSPSFARATCLLATSEGLPERQQTFVSGTASIIGHRTAHPNDLRRQCAETFENIAQLISGPNLANYGIDRGYQLTDLTNLKVYVRHMADLDAVRKLCVDAFSPQAELAFFNVDICRSDLLVEIEGIVPAAAEPAT